MLSCGLSAFVKPLFARHAVGRGAININRG
jgi:hypothetical protein